jgi:transcriptional regulator GlxA family with amidase domain
MEDDLSLDELAQSVGLDSSFRADVSQVNGRDPHRFVLRQRLERAKTMLRAPMREYDVAVICGFKTQHFAQAFRDVWELAHRVSQDLVGSKIRHTAVTYDSQ